MAWRLVSWLPMPLSIKRAMHIHRGIKIRIRLVVTHGTQEEFSPFLLDALAASVGEPLPLGTASRAILRCPMRIDFQSDGAACRVRFVFGVSIDLATQLVRTFAVHAPRLAPASLFDLAQALKEQHTTGIPGADIGNPAGNLVSSVFIHAAHMLPKLLGARLPLHWFAQLPLFFGKTFEMPIAVSVEVLISDKDRLNDPAILSDGDHREILHIEIDGYCHQVRVLFALLHLLRLDRLDLREVESSRLGTQDEFGALGFPGWITPPRFKVAAQFDGIVVPFPSGSRVDLEPSEAGAPTWAQVGPIQVQAERFAIEGGVIAGSRAARLSFLFPGCVPVCQIREKGAHFADGIFDHRATVDERELRELLAKVVGGQGMGMGGRCHGEGFGPGEQLVGGNEPLPFFLEFLREIADTLSQFVRVGQEKGHIEGPSRIQELGRLLQIGALERIGSSFRSVIQIKEQLGGAAGLSHRSSRSPLADLSANTRPIRRLLPLDAANVCSSCLKYTGCVSLCQTFLKVV